MLTATLIYLAFSYVFHLGRGAEIQFPKDKSISGHLIFLIAIPLSLPYSLGRAIQIYLNKNSD